VCRPNWPTERLVPRADILEIELMNDWGARVSLDVSPRTFNPTASGDRYYEIEAEPGLPATGLTATLARSIESRRDPLFRGVPVRVFLYGDNGASSRREPRTRAPDERGEPAEADSLESLLVAIRWLPTRIEE
jgi:hypothetical protein